MTLRQQVLGTLSLALLIILIVVSRKIFETNNEGYYKIKQAAITGDMSVHDAPGTFLQLFGSISEYQVSGMYYFSTSNLDGGEGEAADPILVRFNDGGTAHVSGALKFRLSPLDADQLTLHRDFKSFAAVENDLIRQVVTESLMQTATLMKAEESYSTRRSEFTALAEEQVKHGIYDTVFTEVKEKDVEGNDFIERAVAVKVEKGEKVVRKKSPFIRYKIEILQFVIKDIDFDKTIDDLISKKKEAEQQKIVAKSLAERSKQDAITSFEKGRAMVAIAKAEEEVVKVKAVTQAQKEFEVSQLNRKTQEENAASALAKGEAEAKIARLKVASGLSPQEQAQFKKDTAIGVAEKLSQLKFPSMLIIGGGDSKGGNGATNPFDAIGLDAFIKINERMAGRDKEENDNH